MKPSRQVAREIPVFVVVPPNVLLLDLAGPMEVLRKANLEQQAVRFVATYVGPAPVVGSSIGLSVAGVAPLPERLPDGALVLISGSVSAPMAGAPPAATTSPARAGIVAWLKRVVRPSMTSRRSARERCWRRAPGCWTARHARRTMRRSPN